MRTKSELAGKTVHIKPNAAMIGGADFLVEDWWENINRRSWMNSDGNMAALDYAMRIGTASPDKINVPLDNEVLYGKIGMFGKLVNVREIES